MEQEKNDGTIQDLKNAASELKQNVKNLTEEVHYSKFKFFMIVWVGLTLIGGIIFVALLNETVHTLKDEVAIMAKMNKVIGLLEDRIKALESKIIDLQSDVLKLQTAKFDSRAENYFLPGSTLLQFDFPLENDYLQWRGWQIYRAMLNRERFLNQSGKRQ